MGTEIKLGSLTFASKKDARARVREILASAQVNKPLEGADLSLVSGLLKRHPDYSEKTGVGVESIVVRVNKFGNRSRGFWVIQKDGRQYDFSYNKCFDSPSAYANLKSAMRYAIEPQVAEYRKLAVICEVSGERLVRGEFDIDHEHPWTFEYLSNTWLQLMGIDAESVALEKAQYGRRFADYRLEENWIQFHLKYSRLRAVSRSQHLEITKEAIGDVS